MEDVKVSVDECEQVDSACTMFGKYMEEKQIPARMSNAWWGHFRERSQPRHDASSGIRSVSKHTTPSMARAWCGDTHDMRWRLQKVAALHNVPMKLIIISIILYYWLDIAYVAVYPSSSCNYSFQSHHQASNAIHLSLIHI